VPTGQREVAAKDPDLRVVDNADESRYELWLGDQLAGVIEYAMDARRIVLIHTEIVPSLERRGLGAKLVEAALDDIRGRNLKMVPACPFVRSYLRRHADQNDLVVQDPAVGE
jgi:predicted GNAT family acetyltransferase